MKQKEIKRKSNYKKKKYRKIEEKNIFHTFLFSFFFFMLFYISLICLLLFSVNCIPSEFQSVQTAAKLARQVLKDAGNHSNYSNQY